MSFALFLLLLAYPLADAFQLSQTLTSHMVLQRSPRAATVWGEATPGTLVTTSFLGATYTSVAGPDQVWRQQLPPQPASPGSGPGFTISFNASTGETAVLEDVLFGDVYLCGGQVCYVYLYLAHSTGTTFSPLTIPNAHYMYLPPKRATWPTR